MQGKSENLSQAGFSTISVILLAGIGLVAALGTSQMMSKRVDYLRIIRMQHRLELTEKGVINAAQSMAGMTRSAKSNLSSSLARCLIARRCRTEGSFRSFKLHNSNGTRLDGKRDLSGRPCRGNLCPIQVETSYRIECAAGYTCRTPSRIITRFKIRQPVTSKKLFHGRMFKPRDGEANLAPFVCDDDQYVVGITADGAIKCDYARLSLSGLECEREQAAFGVTRQGFVQCKPVVDYCNKSFGMVSVLDVSASMRFQGKIANARNAASAFLDKLTASDQSAFAAFNHGLVGSSPLTTSNQSTINHINNLRASGFTNMTAGLQAAQNRLNGFSSGPGFVIFLSDGFHNQSSTIGPLAVANTLKKQGVRIFTVGFGNQQDRNLLRQIASSQSDYFDAPDGQSLQEIYGRISKVVCR